ncbi:MAG: MFS transporter [Solirubrobacterales bacterium]|nr:MFS transporter [Solirubrobacterales bacterium]
MDLTLERPISQRLKRGTLAIVCLATMMLLLDIAVVNSALPSISRDLHAGLGGVQWVVDAYALSLAALVLSAGSIADRRGRRLVFATGMVVFTGASLACALSGGIALLDGARAVQGLGAALMFASSLAILAHAFPEPGERAKAMAVYGATIGASFTIGSVVGGGLTSWLGWRSVFFVNVPLGVIALLGTFAWVRESRHPRARKLDWPGQLAIASGMFLLVLALLRGNLDGWASVKTVAELAGAAAMIFAFVVIEQRVSSPLLPLGMFRRRDFTAAQIAAFGISSTFFAIYLYITLYLQNVLGLSPLQAGLTYLPGTVLVFIVSGASANLAGRISPGALLGAGLAMVAGGLALLTTIGPHTSWTVTLPGVLLASLGTGIFNPTLGALALGAGPPESSGLLAGVNDAARQGGIAVGVVAFGALVPAGAALGHGSAGAYVTGLHHALILGSGVAIVGAAMTVALIGRRTRKPAVHVATALDLAAESA